MHNKSMSWVVCLSVIVVLVYYSISTRVCIFKGELYEQEYEHFWMCMSFMYTKKVYSSMSESVFECERENEFMGLWVTVVQQSALAYD